MPTYFGTSLVGTTITERELVCKPMLWSCRWSLHLNEDDLSTSLDTSDSTHVSVSRDTLTLQKTGESSDSIDVLETIRLRILLQPWTLLELPCLSHRSWNLTFLKVCLRVALRDFHLWKHDLRNLVHV